MERFRIVEGVGLYYVTFSVIEWLPIFIDEIACKVITDRLNFCIRKKYPGVNAYVIIPTHLHAILCDVEFNPDALQTLMQEAIAQMFSCSFYYIHNTDIDKQYFGCNEFVRTLQSHFHNTSYIIKQVIKIRYKRERCSCPPTSKTSKTDSGTPPTSYAPTPISNPLNTPSPCWD